MPEEHGIADSSKKRGSDEGTSHCQYRRPAGVKSRSYKGHYSYRRGNQTQAEREAARTFSLLRSCRDYSYRGGHHYGSGGDLSCRHGLRGRADHEASCRHEAVCSAEKPAITHAYLARTFGDPQERQAANRPLQQHGRRVEPDHRARSAVDDS